MKIFLIGCGGFVGAISRYLVSKYATILLGNTIPYGTVLVNIFGSFLLGFLYTMSIEKLAVSEQFRMLAGVGFLGAFTTFSTFSVETIYLLEDGSYLSAGVYFLLNVVLSVAGAYLGISLARVV